MSGGLAECAEQRRVGVIPAETARAVEDCVRAIVILPDPHTRFDKIRAQRARRYLQRWRWNITVLSLPTRRSS
jgi:hypothetical protein